MGKPHWLVIQSEHQAGSIYQCSVLSGLCRNPEAFFFFFYQVLKLKPTTISFPYLRPKHQFFSRAEELICFLLSNNKNLTDVFPFLLCLLGSSEAILKVDKSKFRLLEQLLIIMH